MSDYYETLGTVLRERLDSGTDVFASADGHRTSFAAEDYRAAAEIGTHTENGLKRVSVPDALAEDFAVLRVLPGMPLDLCKQAWKQLLKKYHPDTGSGRLDRQQAETVVRRLNRSYRRIETWFLTGTINTDDE